jgi:uncharacterized protein
MKKILVRFGYFLVALFIIFNVLVIIQAYKTSRFQEIPANGIPQKQSLSSFIFTGLDLYKKKIDTLPSVPFKTIYIINDVGQKLEAWYIPARKAKGTVLLFHGHGSSKGKILPETEYFNKLGYNTFSIDFRAHGNSEGEKCTIGYDETGDIKAAYDWVEKTGEKNKVLWGVSMGAASLLKAIPQYDLKPQKLILECPFGSMEDAVDGFLRKMKIPSTMLSEELLFWGSAINGMWGYNYVPSDYAKEIRLPVLLNWGKKDNRVLRNETQAIYQNLAGKDKKLVIYNYSGHQSYCRNEPLKWKANIAGFLLN